VADAVGPRGSVIIPAWNEANVIGRTLDALLTGIDDGVLDIVVACNGCTDGTAPAAAAFAPRVRVLDLPVPGKADAIRAAEAVTDVLPRLYVDADVVLTGASALAVLTALDRGAIAARPPLRYDTSRASMLVQRYYRQRVRLPGVGRELCGAGVYGLSRSARTRFANFPAVIGDDLFAARVVDIREVSIVDCDPVVVGVPRDLRSLTRTVARVHTGNRELSRLMPELAHPTTRSTVGQLARSVRTPQQLVDAAVYAAVATIGRVRALRPARTWRRDESARTVAG
jgi:hypothetical protein